MTTNMTMRMILVLYRQVIGRSSSSKHITKGDIFPLYIDSFKVLASMQCHTVRGHSFKLKVAVYLQPQRWPRPTTCNAKP